MKKIFLFFLASLSLFSCKEKSETGESVEKNDKEGRLYLFNWTYYTPETIIEKFEKAFNCSVKVDSFDSNEVMYAKLKAGSAAYDITFPSQDYVEIMIKEKMLQKIEHEKIPNIKYITPSFSEKLTYDAPLNYSVPYCAGAAGIAVNKTKVKNYEKSWRIFERKDLKRRMIMMDDMREVMGAALKVNGFSVNSTDKNALAEAYREINDAWKPLLLKFDSEGFAKMFAKGDAWVAQGFAEAFYGELDEKRQAEQIDFFIPKEGGAMYIDSMVILKDAKNAKLAHEFINFILKPEIYAEFLDTFRFPAIVVPEAKKYTKKPPMYDEGSMKNCELKMDLGEKLMEYNELWEEIRY